MIDLEKARKFSRIIELMLGEIRPDGLFGQMSTKDAEALAVNLKRARGCAVNLVNSLEKESNPKGRFYRESGLRSDQRS